MGVLMLALPNEAMKQTSALAEPADCRCRLQGLGQGHRALSVVGARARRSQLIAGVGPTLRESLAAGRVSHESC